MLAPVQLMLDLFDPVAEAPVRVKPPAKPKQVTGDIPIAPLSQVLEPFAWHHPRTNRIALLAGCEVGYEFKRAKRKTIGLVVGSDGLSVRAPKWTPVREVEAFLDEKAAWVVLKLTEARERASQMEQRRIVWADGCVFDFLGKPVQLRLDPGLVKARAGGQLLAPDDAGDNVSVLWLGLAHTASQDQVRDAAQAWLMRQAMSIFQERVAHFEPLLGVQHSRLKLSSASTRWGTASADGTIRLNWRLVHLSMDMIDYVVVHELSHLRHMDHSPQFWSVVASVMPDHQQRRMALRARALAGDA
ncbi:SprT family zinc-dependent metalloprotease [Hydrogenophaga sp. 5NK40-0174]|uniref:M48 family metallopeptidase n=1 Tax=Hydrogenophaga sp. 5NK40-0174 TaxID=3127649 RepID=UPI00310BDD37